MQKILQPGDIEALADQSFERVRLPQPATLFAERAARLTQLAEAGNPIADYLRFCARLVEAQARVAVTTAPLDPAQVALAQQHSMPLMAAAESIDPAWQEVLGQLLAATEMPGDVVSALRAKSSAELDALAAAVLAEAMPAADLAAVPLVMAALQVVFADRASRLRARDVPIVDPGSICPVCASPPVASVLRIGGAAGGYRYLHCGVCCTEWHMVRVKCSHCLSTRGIAYQGVEGNESVVAETCSECGSYRKLVNQEKDPYGEALADDLASVMLDLLMSETEYARAGSNPLLAYGAPDDDGEAA